MWPNVYHRFYLVVKQAALSTDRGVCKEGTLGAPPQTSPGTGQDQGVKSFPINNKVLGTVGKVLRRQKIHCKGGRGAYFSTRLSVSFRGESTKNDHYFSFADEVELLRWSLIAAKCMWHADICVKSYTSVYPLHTLYFQAILITLGYQKFLHTMGPSKGCNK